MLCRGISIKMYNGTQFHRAALSTKFILTRIRLPAKLLCYMYNFLTGILLISAKQQIITVFERNFFSAEATL